MDYQLKYLVFNVMNKLQEHKLRNIVKRILNENYKFFDKELVNAVENFVFKNDKKYIKTIAKYANDIPVQFKSSNGSLYRGMILSQDIIDKLNSGKSFKLTDYSSWTDDVKMAKRFVTDNSKKISKSKGTPIIFKKKLKSDEILLNVQSYISYLYASGKLDEYEFDELTAEMAMEEGETIADKNITLTKNDIY